MLKSLPAEVCVVAFFWIISLISSVVLFAGLDTSFAEGEYLGFKLGGAAAACPVFFMILQRAQHKARCRELEVHVHKVSAIPTIQKADFQYAVRDKLKHTKTDWTRIEQTVHAGDDCFVAIPDIAFDDYVSVRFTMDGKTWESEWVTSWKRHLHFQENESGNADEA